jgi:HK97 family phage prohead protease
MSSAKIERRAIVATELRADSQGDEPVLVGYAALFNTESKDLGGFREVIAPGAFKRSLAQGDEVVALFNHDPNKVLGRYSAGTLQCAEDSRGLIFRCKLDASNSEHMNLRSSVLRGDVKACSFAFTVAPDGQTFAEKNDGHNSYTLRTLTDVNLLDVSAVTYPAYEQTVVAARSTDAAYVAEKKQWLANHLADAERESRALAIAKRILDDDSDDEERGNEDFYSMRDKLTNEMSRLYPYDTPRYIGHDDRHVYALPQNGDDDCCDRFGYALDEQGHVTLDQDSRQRFSLTAYEVSSVDGRALLAALEERDFARRVRAGVGA